MLVQLPNVEFLLFVSQVTTVVGIVDTVVTDDEGGSFFGIYGGRLPARCFSADNALLVFDTVRKYSQIIYTVELGEIDFIQK